MDIQNAKYNEDGSTIEATIDGVDQSIPVNGSNRLYREITQKNISVALYVKNLVTEKAKSIAEIRRQHAEELDKLDLDSSDLGVLRTQNEKNTWVDQKIWAEAYMENPDDLDAKTKLAEMLTENEKAALTVADVPLATAMANNILTEAYKKDQLIVAANHMRRTAEEAIHSATTHEQLDVIKSQLSAAKDAAEADFIEAQQT